jgi:hypothetical protein
MKRLLALAIVLVFYYGVIVFLTNQVNPMEWGILVKIASLFIVFAVLDNYSKYLKSE